MMMLFIVKANNERWLKTLNPKFFWNLRSQNSFTSKALICCQIDSYDQSAKIAHFKNTFCSKSTVYFL